VASITENDNGIGEAAYVTSILEYDGKDRPARIRMPDGTLHCIGYDAEGNVTRYSVQPPSEEDPLPVLCGSSSRTTKYAYETSVTGARLLDSILFPGGNLLTFAYDEADRLVLQRSWGSQDVTDPANAGFARAYTYDCEDNPVSIEEIDDTQVPGGRVARRRIEHYDLETGLSTALEDPVTSGLLTFGYDALWRETLRQDPLASSLDILHDPHSRVGREDFLGFDGLQRSTSYQYDSSGNVISTTVPRTAESSVTVTERFDSFEQRTWRLDPDADPFGMTYAYDELGSLAWIGYNGGTDQMWRNFDGQGRPVSTSWSGSSGLGAIQLDATASSFHEIRRYDTYPTWQGSVAGILDRAAEFGIREEAATGRLVQISSITNFPATRGSIPPRGKPTIRSASGSRSSGIHGRRRWLRCRCGGVPPPSPWERAGVMARSRSSRTSWSLPTGSRRSPWVTAWWRPGATIWEDGSPPSM